MPLNASEIEGFTEAVQTIIDTNGSSDATGGALARRNEDGNIAFGAVKADKFHLPETAFAGERVAIEALASNDPDDVIAKINELIGVANLSRK
jgi:hypothetical protein